MRKVHANIQICAAEFSFFLPLLSHNPSDSSRDHVEGFQGWKSLNLTTYVHIKWLKLAPYQPAVTEKCWIGIDASV